MYGEVDDPLLGGFMDAFCDKVRHRDGVYGEVDDPLLGGFMDAFCDKVRHRDGCTVGWMTRC